MTEPVEVKLKAQKQSCTIMNSKNKYLTLTQVYKLIDQAYKEGYKQALKYCKDCPTLAGDTK